jgi:hypothetical protein
MEGSSVSSYQIVTFYLIIISLMLFISGSIQQREEIVIRFDTVTVQDAEKMVQEKVHEARTNWEE